ncbi:hypothetical protein O6P37_15095 [Mycobacterium sp. CPCC 205372]|uniref:Antitoxin n=1 Tax=Mycobacterium hippophais TaxID=3016340 RepID=A0ABT4PUF3_9MYCO|nr:hypothetical protein [Mycobacterium hippophais]MCZ8380198.1 hypothetical protein [Mycobacterium hippophais]
MDAQSTARSFDGGVAVSTTENGLPVAIRIEDVELQKPPQELAEQIMALCRLSAVRAQVMRRRELTAAHADAAVLRDLRLATEEDLTQAEEAVARGADVLPTSWLRSL